MPCQRDEKLIITIIYQSVQIVFCPDCNRRNMLRKVDVFRRCVLQGIVESRVFDQSIFLVHLSKYYHAQLFVVFDLDQFRECVRRTSFHNRPYLLKNIPKIACSSTDFRLQDCSEVIATNPPPNFSLLISSIFSLLCKDSR